MMKTEKPCRGAATLLLLAAASPELELPATAVGVGGGASSNTRTLALYLYFFLQQRPRVFGQHTERQPPHSQANCRLAQLRGHCPGRALRLPRVIGALGPGADVPCALVVIVTRDQLTFALWAVLQGSKDHPISTAVQQLQPWRGSIQCECTHYTCTVGVSDKACSPCSLHWAWPASWPPAAASAQPC